MKFVWDREYFFCEYCKTYELPEAPLPGIKLLSEEIDLECPICHLPLRTGVAMREEIFHCPRCRGILVDQMAFMRVVRRIRSEATNPPDDARPFNREALQRKICCPSCFQAMNTHPYEGPGNIAIDLCLRCKLVWLDTEELRIIRDAPGSDRVQWPYPD